MLYDTHEFMWELKLFGTRPDALDSVVTV